MTSFADRSEAGRHLGAHLAFLRGEPVTVLGVHRGGVPVAFEVAGVLGAPLDVVVARRLTVPSGTGLVAGAVAEGDVLLLDPEVWEAAGGDARWAGWLTGERAALAGTARALRAAYPALDLSDRTTVVVDDAVRSGWTAQAAVAAVRARGSERVLVAVPVASPSVIVTVGSGAEVVCLEAATDPDPIGRTYRRYEDVGEVEVRDLLRRRQPLSSRE